MPRKENIGNVYFAHALEVVIIKKTSTYAGRSGVSRKEDLRDHHPSNRPRECVYESVWAGMGWSRRPQSHCHPETDPLPNNRPRDHLHTRPRKTQIIKHTGLRRHRRIRRTQTKCKKKKCKTVLFRFNLHWWLHLYRFSASVYVLPGIDDHIVHLNVAHHNVTCDPRQVKYLHLVCVSTTQPFLGVESLCLALVLDL